MLKFLFGKKSGSRQATADAASPSGQPAVGGSAPGTAINYSAELVEKLKSDHVQLVSRFEAIRRAFAARDYAAAAAGLEAFRAAIQAHLLLENVRLYIYLEHQLAQDRASFELIHEFRREMDGIGKAVMGFLDKYRRIEADPRLLPAFAEELDAVGAVLVSRIEREEATLYPLYLPAY